MRLDQQLGRGGGPLPPAGRATASRPPGNYRLPDGLAPSTEPGGLRRPVGNLVAAVPDAVDRLLLQAGSGPPVRLEACAQVEDFLSGLPVAEPWSRAGQQLKGRRVKDNFVNAVVDQCGPAVVRIDTEQKVDTYGEADLLALLFGLRPEDAKREQKRRGHGSGFCVDPAGVILTNSHVVRGADRVTVTFPGSASPLEADVLEEDEVLDVAALRVKGQAGKGLPCLRLGSSQTLKTGDWAIVLGNPLGLNNTCTLGIISSLDRSSGEAGLDWMRHPLVQTDAAVNQGNSGGPLLNETGEVVGMISMRAMFGEGIGFAVPVDSVATCLPSLLQRRKVPRAYIGVKMATVTPEACEMERLPAGTQGALISAVLPESPASAAGLLAGDVIVEAARTRVQRMDHVQSVVNRAQVGSKITLRILRDGKMLNVDVTAEDVRRIREQSDAAAKRAGAAGPGPQRIIIMR